MLQGSLDCPLGSPGKIAGHPQLRSAVTCRTLFASIAAHFSSSESSERVHCHRPSRGLRQ